MGSATVSQSLAEAQRLADEVLLPSALAVDAGADRLGTNLDLLAEKGFYSLAAPEPLTTLDLPDFESVRRVVEIIASGCLTTAFVWVQHHSAVMALTRTENEQARQSYLAPLAAGARRAGLAIGAAVRPGPPLMRAKQTDGGYVFTGEAPWVSGWGLVDTLYTAARDEDDNIVWALVDAAAGPALTASPLEMVAVQASRTVTLHFDGFFVPDERVTGRMPHALWLERESEMLRFNGSLALGVASRAVSLMGGGPLGEQVDAARARLGEAAPHEVAAARSVCSELALRAAAALVAHDGSRAVLLDGHAQRLLREATFLLVFGTRPAIRAGLLELLTTPR